MTCHASAVARSVTAAGASWSRAVAACLGQLEPLPGGANLGVAYVGDQLAPMADAIVGALRAGTGIARWLGVGGAAVLDGRQGPREDGLSVLVLALPEDGFEVAASLRPALAGRGLVLAHAALDEADTAAGLLAELALSAPATVVGGLAAASRAPVHLAGGAGTAGSAATLALRGDLPAAAGLARACSPLGPAHRVTSALGPLILGLDGRPALEVMTEELGDLFRHAGRRAARQLWLADAGAPATGAASAAGDAPLRVRRVVAADAARGALRVEGRRVGAQVRLMRPDPAASLARLAGTARGLRAALNGRGVAAGLYLASRHRGPQLFGPRVDELGVVRAELGGGVPLVGLVTDAELFGGAVHEGAGVLVLLGEPAREGTAPR